MESFGDLGPSGMVETTHKAFQEPIVHISSQLRSHHIG